MQQNIELPGQITVPSAASLHGHGHILSKDPDAWEGCQASRQTPAEAPSEASHNVLGHIRDLAPLQTNPSQAHETRGAGCCWEDGRESQASLGYLLGLVRRLLENHEVATVLCLLESPLALGIAECHLPLRHIDISGALKDARMQVASRLTAESMVDHIVDSDGVGCSLQLVQACPAGFGQAPPSPVKADRTISKPGGCESPCSQACVELGTSSPQRRGMASRSDESESVTGENAQCELVSCFNKQPGQSTNSSPRRKRRCGILYPNPSAASEEPVFTGVACGTEEHVSISTSKKAERSECGSLDSTGAQRVGTLDDLDDLAVEQMEWMAKPSDRFILHPNSFARITWDLVLFALVLFECITVPLAICLNPAMPDWFQLCTLFFAMDIALNFGTGYFRGSLLVMRRSWITHKYLRTWFLLDVVATIPWDLFFAVAERQTAGETTMLRMMRMGKLTRVLRLLRLAKMLSGSGNLHGRTFSKAAKSNRVNFAFMVTKMFVSFAIVCHWAACVWAWIGDPANMWTDAVTADPYTLEVCTMGGPCEPGVIGSPWRHRYGLDNYDVWMQYLTALHFTSGLITGGDSAMQPGQPAEIAFTITMMILSVFISSAIMSQVVLMMSRESEINLAFEEQMRRVHDFLATRKVPTLLQAKIQRYLVNQFEVQRAAGSDRDFLRDLSPWLQVELTEHLNRSVIARHPFFKKLPGNVLRSVCLKAETIFVAPGDIVVEKGHVALSMFIIVRGKLRILEALGPRSVYLEAPMWLGDRCLFIDAARTHTVSAVTHSELVEIHKNTVNALRDEFPLMNLAFMEFRAHLLQGDDTSLKCGLCHGLGHVAEDCPWKEASHHEEISHSRPGASAVWARPVRMPSFRSALAQKL